MKNKLYTFVVAALLFVAAPAFAGDVDGTWAGNIDSPNGPVPVSFTFKSEGTTLTGVTRGPDGTEIPLKNGKVEGEKIAFSFDVDFGQGPFTFAYTGIVSKTELKLHTDFMGTAIDFALKKAP
jgi:hypothetical protein